MVIVTIVVVAQYRVYSVFRFQFFENWNEVVYLIGAAVYNIAGEEDPCGSFGEGVELVSKWLEDTGHDIDTMIYIGYRHEIHNYSDLKDQVEDDMIEFLDKIAK